MSNTKSQRLHVQSNTEASELNLAPGMWPDTVRFEGTTFKKNLRKLNIDGSIAWCDYVSNTEEQHWILRVYND